MKNRLIIIGAGGHGKVVADLAVKVGYTDISFVDDMVSGTCLGFPILGARDVLEDFDDGATDFVIAIGCNEARERIAKEHALPWITMVHPSAQIGLDVKLGAGTVVMAGAIINAGASVGAQCIVNSGAIVEHGNEILDFVHVSPGVTLGGTVTIGAGTHVGIGATVRNNIQICSCCVIGAGAVVVRDITEAGVYVGVPAVFKKPMPV